MDFEQLFAEFRYEDLEWFIPVSAGLIIVILSLLIGIVRGISAGVIMAIVVGSAMTLSPVLLDALEPPQDDETAETVANVARSAAQLAELNNDLVVDLSRVVTSMRLAMENVPPALPTAPEGEEPDPDQQAAVQRFQNSVADVEERINAVAAAMQRSGELRQALSRDLSTLDARDGETPVDR